MKSFLLTSLFWLDITGTMKLNIKKIDLELKRIGKSWYWLSKELKRSWQVVRYWRESKSIRGAEPIAGVFGISPKDLIE